MGSSYGGSVVSAPQDSGNVATNTNPATGSSASTATPVNPFLRQSAPGQQFARAYTENFRPNYQEFAPNQQYFQPIYQPSFQNYSRMGGAMYSPGYGAFGGGGGYYSQGMFGGGYGPFGGGFGPFGSARYSQPSPFSSQPMPAQTPPPTPAPSQPTTTTSTQTPLLGGGTGGGMLPMIDDGSYPFRSDTMRPAVQAYEQGGSVPIRQFETDSPVLSTGQGIAASDMPQVQQLLSSIKTQ